MAEIILKSGLPITGISGKIGGLIFNTRKATGKIYARRATKNVRSTPITEKEMAARNLFAETMEKYKALSPHEIEWFKARYKKTRGKMFGKTYKTLSGFIKAFLHNEIKNGY